MTIHDTREREWRHDNLSDTVCYIHARVPRCKCSSCRKIMQIDVPWAEPKVTYTKMFEERAIHMMSQMSLAAASRELHVSWRILDYIVDRRVEKYLDGMNLRYLRRVRIDETAAKKHHRYITVVTDMDTGQIVFICKGKNRDILSEFKIWLSDHNGMPENIVLFSTDFGRNFIAGIRENFPNAENVYDPFHLIHLANKKLDADRAANQVNGERKMSIKLPF